jgi:hypothetical protein
MQYPNETEPKAWSPARRLRLGADRQMEPVSAEARRMARLRSDCDLWLLSTDDQGRAELGVTIGRRPGRCGCWPVTGCGGWPDRWRRLGWRGV